MPGTVRWKGELMLPASSWEAPSGPSYVRLARLHVPMTCLSLYRVEHGKDDGRCSARAGVSVTLRKGRREAAPCCGLQLGTGSEPCFWLNDPWKATAPPTLCPQASISVVRPLAGSQQRPVRGNNLSCSQHVTVGFWSWKGPGCHLVSLFGV